MLSVLKRNKIKLNKNVNLHKQHNHIYYFFEINLLFQNENTSKNLN